MTDQFPKPISPGQLQREIDRQPPHTPTNPRPLDPCHISLPLDRAQSLKGLITDEAYGCLAEALATQTMGHEALVVRALVPEGRIKLPDVKRQSAGWIVVVGRLFGDPQVPYPGNFACADPRDGLGMWISFEAHKLCNIQFHVKDREFNTDYVILTDRDFFAYEVERSI